MKKRVAMISVHECPLASSEGKERGGINVYTFELSKALTKRGWHVDAFTRIQDDINPRIVQVHDTFRVIHLPNGPHRPLTKKEILNSLPEFTNALRPYIHRYDVVHAHYYLSGVVAESLGVPYIMTFHTLGLMKQLVSRSEVSDDPTERIPLERALVRSARRIITASEAGKDYLTSIYDATPDNIAVVPPGVDTTLFRPIAQHAARHAIGADQQSLMILAVGRIDPVKGFDVLLYALKILLASDPKLCKRICVCIIGGNIESPQTQWSKELKRLTKLRKELGLTTTVTFVPPMPQEKLPYYYNAADLLVMPSHYESFGMVALEALACDIPVIATDVTGISPILKDLSKGHIISANNPIALANEIAHVLSQPHAQKQRSTIIQSFDWDAIAERIEKENYNALLAAGS